MEYQEVILAENAGIWLRRVKENEDDDREEEVDAVDWLLNGVEDEDLRDFLGGMKL